MSATTEEVIRLERRFWDESTNPAFFQQTVGDDTVMVFEPRGIIGKPQAVEMSGRAAKWKDVELTEVVARELAPNCVALTYRGAGRRLGEQEVYRARISSVYVHRQGRWQLGFTQHQALTE